MDVSTCRHLIEEVLSSYVDDELDPATSQRLELHMQLCAPCAAFLRTFLAARTAARSEVMQNIPPECEHALWHFLENELGMESCSSDSNLIAEKPSSHKSEC